MRGYGGQIAYSLSSGLSYYSYNLDGNEKLLDTSWNIDFIINNVRGQKL